MTVQHINKSAKAYRTRIEELIFLIRGQKVMLDYDLAKLYGVTTGALVQAMKRNIDRFPADFVFQLSKSEFDSLRSQFVTSNGRGGRRKLPHAFTEHGALMLASVLNSERAIETSVYVVRAFVRLREVITAHKSIAQKLGELEKRIGGHDIEIRSIVEALRQLMAPAPPRNRKIGFEK